MHASVRLCYFRSALMCMLDADVLAGIICITFSKDMTRTIATCFMDRVVDKYYLAIVQGHLSHTENHPPADNQQPDDPHPSVDNLHTDNQPIGNQPTTSALSDNPSVTGASSPSRIPNSPGVFFINAPIADDPSDPNGFKCCVGSDQNPGQVCNHRLPNVP